MSTMYCPRCREPWNFSHVRNEAFEGDRFDGPENMPADVREPWDAWVATDPYSGTDDEREARDRLGLAYYNTGLGSGCTACWADPSRVLDGDAAMAAVEEALYRGTWDGDPMEILDRLF